MTGRDLPPHEQGLLVLASQFPWTSHGDDRPPRRERWRAGCVVLGTGPGVSLAL